MLILFGLLLGFTAGLSLGAILNWRDDNYQSKSGLIWVFSFVIGVSGIILVLLKLFKLT